MKAFTLITIIYIDYDAALKIIKQISLITSLIDKLNFCLIRASDYLQRFNLNIRYKFDKQHNISDVLSRLTFDNNILQKFFINNELNALHISSKKFFAKKFFADMILFIAFLIEVDSKFKRRVLKKYKSDLY